MGVVASVVLEHDSVEASHAGQTFTDTSVILAVDLDLDRPGTASWSGPRP